MEDQHCLRRILDQGSQRRLMSAQQLCEGARRAVVGADPDNLGWSSVNGAQFREVAILCDENEAMCPGIPEHLLVERRAEPL